jgi:hypothetical protein
MKQIYFALLAMLISGFVNAQTPPAPKPAAKPAAKGNKTWIKNVNSIYDIRLGAYSKGLSDNAFNNLKDLGLLKVINNEDGMLLVYLGSYMGKHTADKILATVKSRGYKTAYIEAVKTDFINAQGIELTHTYQFCSVKRLDVRRIGNIIAQDVSLLDKLYISFDGSHYQMSLGLVSPAFSPEIPKYAQFAATAGFSDGFLRTFRPATVGYVPPTPVVPEVVKENPAPTPAPKPSPTAPKDDKMSGNNTANTAAKDDKMNGSKTTTTDAKNNKMNGGK